MGGMQAPMPVKKGSISAVVTRADGTVVNLGKVSHSNPWLNRMYQLKLRFYKAIGRM